MTQRDLTPVEAVLSDTLAGGSIVEIQSYQAFCRNELDVVIPARLAKAEAAHAQALTDALRAAGVIAASDVVTSVTFTDGTSTSIDVFSPPAPAPAPDAPASPDPAPAPSTDAAPGGS